MYPKGRIGVGNGKTCVQCIWTFKNWNFVLFEFVARQLFSHDPFGFQKKNMHTGMYQDFLLVFQTFKFQVITK